MRRHAIALAAVMGAVLVPLASRADNAAGGSGYPLELTAGSRLLVDASVNGHAVKALLDSAAEASLVDVQFARDIGLHAGAAVQGQGSGGSFQARFIQGVTLSAFGLELRNQEIAETDLSDVGRRLLGRKIDLVLGREIFDAARLEIDLHRARIRVLSRSEVPRGQRLPLVAEHGVETLPVRVEGHRPVRATFDLGNGSGVLVSRDYARRMGFLEDGRPFRQLSGGGLGGAEVREVFSLRSLQVAGRQLRDVQAAIDPHPSASALNIGISVLSHFLITTDFPAHALWLQPVD